MKALKYLQKKEWSMGNGQCPECFGMPKKWLGHPCCMDTDQIGHKPDCGIGLAIRELGGDTLFLREVHPKIELEYFIDSDGQEKTRPKTKDGCPILKEKNKKANQHFLDNIAALWDA